MKKSIQLLLLIVSLGIATTIAQADNNSGVTFSNITKTSATINLRIGADEFANAVTSRQPVKMKYRKANETKETELSFQYGIESSIPTPITLSNLVPNQEYVVRIGHRATRTCMSEELCAAIYTKYGTQEFRFKTARDPIVVSGITKKLSYGDKASEVVLLKKYLFQKGYMKYSSTNSFDVPTLVGVIKFQMAQNLETDGVIGTSGRAIINKELTIQANAQ